MSTISIVWSSGKAYASIHKVHDQILSLAANRGDIHTWVLQGQEDAAAQASGRPLYWQTSTRALKGKGVWRLLQWRLQRRLAREIGRVKPKAMLLDGIGVARLIVPVVVGSHAAEPQVIVVFHGEGRLREKDKSLLSALPAHRLKLIAVSEALAESLRFKLGMPVTAARTATNPHSFRQSLIPGHEARARLGVDRDCLLLGAVGRLVEGKGYLAILDVMIRLSRSRDDLHLVIVGEGAQRSELEKRIRSLGLESKVTLAGYRDDAARLYRAFDVMLIPSHNEGLGLVLQEAVLARVPVVCSDLPVFIEQLGPSGVYVATDDISGWVGAVGRVIDSDRELLAGEQDRQLAPEVSWKQFCKGYADLLLSDGDSDPVKAL
ncbi:MULTISPECIES: glycosyltransferase [unclassified Pseudomonas]|uniref:glycosyltransferase n=1 Tax=unclassified Pseudomonas TaxID=196821 RepID=UPI000E07D363|nr:MULTISPECIES: glycosyltransferase [unclassified Pseudomonas]NKQ11200.1 glycosyltransferase [Pseudomonas sp. SST3]